MKIFLQRVRQAGASNSRVSGILVISTFAIMSALFGARTAAPVVSINVPRANPRISASPTPAFCNAPAWTQLSPTGTAPDVNSQQFASDGKGSLIMFGGCGPTGCNGSTNTFVLRDAFGVGGLTQWIQLSTSGGPPGARHSHILAYDSGLNELIVSAGCAGGCLPLATDMWSLSNGNGLDQTTVPTWTSRGTAPNSGFGSGQFGAVDSTNHVLMI
ncbi:MAG TPA: hypothetical protein VFA58_01675, partial [Chthoniobacterales bacterium]|nr:hypothetical protein [Chthoniobacterales bacterium]